MELGQEFCDHRPRIFILQGSDLAYPHVDAPSILVSNRTLLEKFLSSVEFLRSEWPNARAPKLFQAMHGEMAGFFEIRLQVARINYRFFIRTAPQSRARLVVCAGAAKPRRTGFPSALYSDVRELWEVFLSREDREQFLFEIQPLEDSEPKQV